jgi:DNA polymerase-3 subunit epsilon
MPEEAFAVHGLSNAFLADKPLFGEIAEELLAFIGSDPLVIHNAQFDMKFLNFELEQVGLAPLSFERVTDTLSIARRKFPGAPAKLDALCKRFNIDLSQRTKHGALLDAELLADVYLELMGGRQEAMMLSPEATIGLSAIIPAPGERLMHRAFPPAAAELTAHALFLKEIKNPIWLRQEEEA